MSELSGFKLVTTLVLEFKKIESEDKTKFDTFYLNSKAEIIINESDTDDGYYNSILYYSILFCTYILQLYQTCKNP